ncbi:MAG: metallophosphoesterase [Chitinivibrionales bacterium]|nr:metallophosphoesterase [Chitinivibrionales bacterium]
MRLAIISDIHANLEALEAVFEDIEYQNIDETICLGDIVGYAADPNRCIELIKACCPLTLLGNHDAAGICMLSTVNFNVHARLAIEWTSENLSNESKSFLHVLPLKKVRYSQSFVHSTPYEPNMWHYITSLEEAAYNFRFFDTDFCFIGHTHIPLIIVVNNRNELYVHQDTSINLQEIPNARLLINIGSIGQPRDHDPRSCYGILDTEEGFFTFRRVEYDIKRCQDKMKKIKMPEFLITRLEKGQ